MKNEKVFAINYSKDLLDIIVNKNSVINGDIKRYGDVYLNGTNNRLFIELDKCYYNSQTNNSVIKRFVNYVIGEGVYNENGLSVEDILSYDDFEKIALDYKKSGNAALQIVYNAAGFIKKIYHIDIKCIGVNVEDDITDEPTAYWYCFNWSEKSKYDQIKYPAFGKGEMIYVNDQISIKQDEIFYIKGKDTSYNHLFSRPDYYSGLKYCYVEDNLGKFFLRQIEDNFTPAVIININGGDNYDDKQLDQLVDSYTEKFTGPEAKRFIVSVNSGSANKTEIETISVPDLYKEKELVEKTAINKILQSHGVNNPSLFGIIKPSGFSSEAEDREVSLNDLKINLIRPYRRTLENALNKIFEVNNIKITIKDVESSNNVG